MGRTSHMDESKVVIQMKDIVKKFGDFTANDHINLTVHKGEVHAILGENGAGKSTMMNVLCGLYKPTSGQIFINEKEVHFNSPKDAIDIGIGMVHQHFMLIQPFTVTENIILGMEPTKGLTIDKETAKEKVMELSERYGMKVDPDAKVEDISVGMQQRVEILKVLYRGAETLILDEPTLRVVYAPSQYFASEPKADISLVLRNPQAMDSARRQVMFALNDYLAGIALDQLSNQAAVGGISFSTGANNGLMVNANGYTQHLPALFSDLLQGYFSYTPTEEQLEQAKSWYAQMMDSAEKGKAYDQAIMPIQMVSQVPYFQREVRRALLPSITLKEVLNYRANLKPGGVLN